MTAATYPRLVPDSYPVRSSAEEGGCEECGGPIYIGDRCFTLAFATDPKGYPVAFFCSPHCRRAWGRRYEQGGPGAAGGTP